MADLLSRSKPCLAAKAWQFRFLPSQNICCWWIPGGMAGKAAA